MTDDIDSLTLKHVSHRETPLGHWCRPALDEVIYVVTDEHAKTVKARDETRRAEVNRRTGPSSPSVVLRVGVGYFDIAEPAPNDYGTVK